ncbi:unnamed protein product [Symbiodinium sp. CCMP2592]|nr:unnamed protein product [Symbiodinium sp. CCMP2592]
MNAVIEIPSDLCSGRAGQGVLAGKAQLPKWLLLYTGDEVPAGGDARRPAGAEIRMACKISAVQKYLPGRMHTGLLTQEVEAWNELKFSVPSRSSGYASSTAHECKFCEWVVEKQFTFSQPIAMTRLQFPGKQFQRVCTATPEIVQTCKQSGGRCSGTLNRNAAGPGAAGAAAAADGGRLVDASFDRPWLIRVPRSLHFLSENPDGDANRSFCTPVSVAKSLHLPVGEPPNALAVQVQPVKDKLSPSQQLSLLRMNFSLQFAADMRTVLSCAVQFLNPFLGSVDEGMLQRALGSLPHFATVRKWMLKLDLLSMHFRRRLMRSEVAGDQVRVARYLSMDASPQAGYEYLATTEETIRRCVPVQASACPWKGFTHEFRTMVITTLGRGETRAFLKACRLRHAIILENGPDYEDTYRAQVKGWVSDQGTERKVPQMPVSGDPAELQALAALVAAEGDPDVEHLVRGTSKALLWNSFRHLGLMHVMFNSLEESCKGCPRWDSFEKQLSAISKLLRDRSFRDIVVHRMMATATAQEKSTVQAYHGELLSWRWESLYETLKHYVHVRPILMNYWDRELLSSEAQLCDAVGEALTDPFHSAYAEWAFMFSGFVQRWSRWMEGCFCHESELKEAKTRKAREAISCCWKGKRTAVLAAGYGETILAEARACTSPRYAEAVLRLPREVAAMAFMDQQAREKWATVFESKTVYFQQLPFRLAGAYAHFCMPERYTLEGSKKIVAECFREYDRLCAVGRVDALLHGIFQRQGAAATGVAEQLWAFANSPSGPHGRQLEDFPLAWAEIQERAFCSCVERATEKQHVLIKIGARRTLRFSGPAMACVRARRRQHEAFMDDGVGRVFLLENWPKQSLDVELLSHVLPRSSCWQKTFAYRLSRVYGYNEADHFMETGETEASAEALGDATDKALKSAAALVNGEALFDTLQAKSVPDERQDEEDAGKHTLLDMAQALIPKDVVARKAEDHVYSYVVDARPERRHQQLGVGSVKNRHVLQCIRFLQVSLEDLEQPRVSYTSVRKHDLDLSAVATQAGLEMMSSACVVWLPQCTSLQVKLQAELLDSSTGVQAAPLRLPAVVSDEDMLCDLAEEDRERQELELVVPENKGVDVSATMVMSDLEQALVDTLFQRRAVADNFVPALGLPYFGIAAAQSLSEKGILQVREDDFGELQLSLTEKMQVRGVVTLTDPVSLADHEPQMQSSAGRNKLSWLKLLLMQDWKPGQRRKKTFEWRHKDEARELPGNMLSRPEFHFRALAFEATIFEKPGNLSKISHCGSSAYYELLLTKEDLTGIGEWTLEQTMKFAWPRKRKQGSEPKSRVARPRALEPPMQLQIEMPGEKPVQSRVPGLEGLTVYFDNFTHQSGRRRAFIACGCAAHKGQCRRYVFVTDYPSIQDCVAWLLTWASAAQRFRTTAEHVGHNPTSEAVRSMKQRQSLGL